MGIDIGSLSAKGVLLADGQLRAQFLRGALFSASASIDAVVDGLCRQAKLPRQAVEAFCLTGYGRFQAPFEALEKSEIACHALGAWTCDTALRSVIDIGGQDSKVIALDERGGVLDFAMNEKCAAGTGRALELLAKALGVEVEQLGPLALGQRSSWRKLLVDWALGLFPQVFVDRALGLFPQVFVDRALGLFPQVFVDRALGLFPQGCWGSAGAGERIRISSRCSLYMELDVLQLRREGVAREAIAEAIVEAVVERVLSLASRVPLQQPLCLSGGVAKNAGVVAALERQLGYAPTPLAFDPQLLGALGAAHFAARSLRHD
jgi:activator of 2-hydroxyglutaryl-CoA dehydratase